MDGLSSESEENIIKLDDFKVKFNPYQDLNTSINYEEMQRWKLKRLSYVLIRISTFESTDTIQSYKL